MANLNSYLDVLNKSSREFREHHEKDEGGKQPYNVISPDEYGVYINDIYYENIILSSTDDRIQKISKLDDIYDMFTTEFLMNTYYKPISNSPIICKVVSIVGSEHGDGASFCYVFEGTINEVQLFRDYI